MIWRLLTAVVVALVILSAPAAFARDAFDFSVPKRGVPKQTQIDETERYGVHGEYAHPPRATSGSPTTEIRVKKGEYCWSYSGSAWAQFHGKFYPYQFITISATQFARVHDTGELGTSEGVELKHPKIVVQATAHNHDVETIRETSANEYVVPDISGEKVDIWISVDQSIGKPPFEFTNVGPHQLVVHICTVNTPGP